VATPSAPATKKPKTRARTDPLAKPSGHEHAHGGAPPECGRASSGGATTASTRPPGTAKAKKPVRPPTAHRQPRRSDGMHQLSLASNPQLLSTERLEQKACTHATQNHSFGPRRIGKNRRLTAAASHDHGSQQKWLARSFCTASGIRRFANPELSDRPDVARVAKKTQSQVSRSYADLAGVSGRKEEAVLIDRRSVEGVRPPIEQPASLLERRPRALPIPLLEPIVGIRIGIRSPPVSRTPAVARGRRFDRCITIAVYLIDPEADASCMPRRARAEQLRLHALGARVNSGDWVVGRWLPGIPSTTALASAGAMNCQADTPAARRATTSSRRAKAPDSKVIAPIRIQNRISSFRAAAHANGVSATAMAEPKPAPNVFLTSPM